MLIILAKYRMLCWDERLYKEHSVVSLVGAEGIINDVKAYYSYSESKPGSAPITTIIEGEGKSPLDARMHAELKVEQSLDLTMLSSLLIGTDTAESGLKSFLDVYYRNSLSSISALVAVVEGDMKDYMVASQSWSAEAGEYYSRLIESTEIYAYVPHVTIQDAGAILYSSDMDLVLPYITIQNEQQRPEIGGAALFSNNSREGC